MKIALVRCSVEEYYSGEGIADEDSVLLAALLGKGLDVEPAVWNDASVDWTRYDLAILKSPWGYDDHIEEFYAWLDTLESLGVRVLNPANTVRWNSNKRYLRDIAEAGLPVVPTEYLAHGTHADLAPYFERFRAEKLVVKPCVSASAKNTVVVSRDTLRESEQSIDRLLMDAEYLVQPFMEEILEGEWSHLFFGGTYSHSLLKVPKRGDFRVQHFFGGVVLPRVANTSEVREAAQYVERFASDTLYARVDGVTRGGTFHLMELELIEPYLYLDASPNACKNYCRALLQRVME
ncbi:MAG: hypothetical protein Q8922_04080 [Bacteroidota bacterium]|nr:hypothetical protein [Bacteroidota bacterium]MDP4231758.1 hypothetical protein [Bacteroidota bacterium]MDP4243494.1 hypothetical protein [Bacteroidota bacterium]MDP4287095.1 hypothetical protein [Bacteroidota bacterium]